jgi:transcriptional regulator with XRE-family HTH domain
MRRTNSTEGTSQYDARVAAYLRGLMSARQVTLDELAEATGMSRATLERRRKAKAGFTLDELGRLADYFDVPLGQFAEPPDLRGDVRRQGLEPRTRWDCAPIPSAEFAGARA